MISYKNQLYNKKIIIIGFIVTIMLATISSLNYKHGIILILLFLVAHIPIMRNNLYMIYMILFFLPLHGMLTHIWLSGNAIYWKEILVLYSFVLTIIKGLDSKKITIDFVTIIVILYSMFFLVISFGNYNSTITIRGLSVYVLYVAFYFNILFSIDDYTKVYRTLIIITISTILVAIGGILQSLTQHSFFMTGPIEAKRFNLVRASFSTGSSIVFGCFMAIIATILFAKLYYGVYNNKNKLLLKLFLFITCLALILSFTRVAWVQFIISFFVLILLKNWKKSKLVIFFILCSLLITIIYLPHSNSIVVTFLKEGIHDRSGIWMQSLELFMRNPFTGSGVGSTLWANRDLRNDEFVSESFFLQLLVETGIIGFCLFISILGVSIFTNCYEGFKSTNELKWLYFGISGALIGLSINMLFAQAFNSWIINMIFWYLIGLGGVIKKITYDSN